MHLLRTAVLEHTTADGVHHDWLIEDPTLPDPHAPDARLWTARVPAPPSQWPALGRFELDVIAPHRRVYLEYQGPISGGRGRVRRVAHGLCIAHLWSRTRLVLGVQLSTLSMEVRLTGTAGGHWLGLVSARSVSE